MTKMAVWLRETTVHLTYNLLIGENALVEGGKVAAGTVSEKTKEEEQD